MQYLLQNQASPEITINEALARIDAMILGIAQSVVDVFPGDPLDGGIYILSVNNTAHANGIAIYTLNKGWQIIPPKIGVRFYVLDSRKYVRYTESGWVDENTAVSSELSGLHSVAFSGNYNELNNKPYLHSVASSGSYNDLTDKPSFKSVSWTGSYNDLTDKPVMSVAIGDYKFSAQNGDHAQWLLCNGRDISREKYAKLFQLIGTNFGTGDGSTTFNLPDSRGRVVGAIGQGEGLTARNLGSKAGSETHTLTVNEIPSHHHTSPDGSNFLTDSSSNNTLAGGGAFKRGGKTTQNTGGSQAHNNMQPTLFAGNLFIYSGV